VGALNDLTEAEAARPCFDPGSGDASPQRIAGEHQNIAVSSPEVGSRDEPGIDESEFLERWRVELPVPRPIGPEEKIEVPMRPAFRVDPGGVRLREHLGTSQFEMLEPELLSDDPFRPRARRLELDQMAGRKQPPVLERFEVRRFEAADLRPGRRRCGSAENDQIRILLVPDEDEYRKAKPRAGSCPHPAARDLAFGGTISSEPAGGRRVHAVGDVPRSYGLCFRSGAGAKAAASPEI